MGDVLTLVLMALSELPEGTPGKVSADTFAYLREHAAAGDLSTLDPVVADLQIQATATAAVLAIASQLVSVIKAWSVRIVPDPKRTRLGVGDERIEGTVDGRIDFGGLSEWPSDLLDCASMAGIELPVPTGKGSTIAWEVGETGVTSFTYATVSEDPETAAGEERTGKVTFRGTITRADREATQQALADANTPGCPISTRFTRRSTYRGCRSCSTNCRRCSRRAGKPR